MLLDRLDTFIVDVDLPTFLKKLDEMKHADLDVRVLATSIYFLLQNAKVKARLSATEKDLYDKYTKIYEKYRDRIATLINLIDGTEIKDDMLRILSAKLAEAILRPNRSVALILGTLEYGKRLAVDYGLPVSPTDLLKLVDDYVYLPAIYGVETFSEERDELPYNYGKATAVNDVLKARWRDFAESVLDEDVFVQKLSTYFVGYEHGDFEPETIYYLLDVSSSMGTMVGDVTKLAIAKAVILKMMKRRKGKVGIFSGNLVDVLDMKKKGDVLKFLSVKPFGGTDLLASLVSFVRRLKTSASITVVTDGYFPYYDVKNVLAWHRVQLNFVVIGDKSEPAEKLARLTNGRVVYL